MPRPRNPRPKISIHRGSERVHVGTDWHTLGPVGSKEAKAEYARVLALLAADPHATLTKPKRYYLVELGRDYLASDAVPPGYRFQCGRAVELLAELFLAKPASEFSAVDLGTWQRWLCDLKDAAGNRKYARGYVTKLVGIVKRVVKWGEAVGRLPPGSRAHLDTVRAPRLDQSRPGRKPARVSDQDFAATVAFLPRSARGLVCLLRWTGARPSELAGLRSEDIERGGCGNSAPPSLNEWYYMPLRHKTAHHGHERVIVFGPVARKVIDRYSTGDGLLFPNRNGGTYNRNSLRLVLNRACAAAGVKRWSVYACRHARATEVRQAMGEEAARAILGHSHLSTTRLYGERDRALAARVAAESG